MLCEKCKKIVTRELNALGDVIENRLDIFEKSIDVNDNSYATGQMKGAIQAIKDMRDNLSRFSEQLGL